MGGWQVDQIQHLKIRKSSDIVPSTSMIEPSQYLDDGKKEWVLIYLSIKFVSKSKFLYAEVMAPIFKVRLMIKKFESLFFSNFSLSQ